MNKNSTDNRPYRPYECLNRLGWLLIPLVLLAFLAWLLRIPIEYPMERQ